MSIKKIMFSTLVGCFGVSATAFSAVCPCGAPKECGSQPDFCYSSLTRDGDGLSFHLENADGIKNVSLSSIHKSQSSRHASSEIGFDEAGESSR